MEIFRQIAISQVPRILGFADRNANSETYGCFDRYYWHYKLHDFANARFQESALLLAILYQNKFKDNIFFKNKKILRWWKAVVGYWAKMQRRDGSFDEAYGNEHSFIATAFTTYAITESMLVLKKPIFLANVEKAGKWLIKNSNIAVANQMAGAAIALYNIYLLTNKAKYKIGAQKKIQQLLASQTKEGYFPEYNGYDIGYLSICLSYLKKYYEKTKVEALKPHLLMAVKFAESTIRSDGSYDITKTSRKTRYIYPYSFHAMKNDVVKKLLNGLEKNRTINPAWMDDRFCIPLTIDYLQTYLK